MDASLLIASVSYVNLVSIPKKTGSIKIVNVSTAIRKQPEDSSTSNITNNRPAFILVTSLIQSRTFKCSMSFSKKLPESTLVIYSQKLPNSKPSSECLLRNFLSTNNSLKMHFVKLSKTKIKMLIDQNQPNCKYLKTVSPKCQYTKTIHNVIFPIFQ